MTPHSRYVTLLDHEIHYMAWGAKDLPPLILWHGLARTGRDFDDLAAALAGRYHVLVPDTIGRGLSQWSADPARDYCNDHYARIAAAFLDALELETVDWVGTSMGGAIAIRAAASTLKGRIRRLVLNDMGPNIADAAIARIKAYVGTPPAFERVSALEAYFRQVYAPYGHLTDDQWRRMAETSVRRLPDGRITPHYDPAIVMQFTQHADDYAQWAQWDGLTCDVLCLRGATSDLLLAPDAEAMTRRGPRCELVTVPGCGHAPALNVPEQIQRVAAFLARA